MCGAPLGEVPPERRKPATLVFCDIAGSTALGERLDAESMRGVQLAYFEQMRTALEGHGGTVEKFIGDAVVGAFGVPVAHEDDAMRALRAAVEMRERIASLNDELEQRYGVRLAVRIGVNSGEVVAGDPATSSSFVGGDAVNVAARLEAAAGPGEILVGELTVRAARDAAEVEPVAPLSVKGKSEPMPAYRLVSVGVGVPLRPPAGRTPMVGRDAELARLADTFDLVVESRFGRAVLIAGEAGVGKSRLVEELGTTVGPNLRMLVGRCLSYGDGVTYWPLAEIVRVAAVIDPLDGVETVRRRLSSLVEGEQRAGALAAVLVDVLGIGTGTSSTGDFAWATRRLLEHLSRDAPVLVVFDDLHWAETPFLELVEGLVARPPAGPVLLIGLTRPELLEMQRWETLKLEPLQEKETTRLVEELLTGAALDDPVRRRAVAAAGGNPLFAEELVAMLVDDPRAEIPPTIDTLLRARLDLLPAAELAVAERAAVEGAVFHTGAVAELSNGADVSGPIEGLKQRELVAPADAWLPNETAFRFRHILIRDAAYRGVSKRLRSELHELYANWLEYVARDRVAEYGEIIAYHLEQAFHYLEQLGPVDYHGRGLARRAGTELIVVGERASARGDSGAAASAYSRALELFGSEAPGRARLLAELVWIRFETGEIEAARVALAEARASGDEVAAARATIASVSLRLSTETGSAAELRDEVIAVVPVLEWAGDELGLARAWRAIGSISLYYLARGSDAAIAFDRALSYAARARAPREELLVRGLLCTAAARGPMPAPKAIALCKATLAVAGGSLLLEALVSESLGLLLGRSGSPDDARTLLATARANRVDLGQHLAVAGSAEFTGTLELHVGDLGAAERELRAGCEALERIGATSLLASLFGRLAETLYEQGRADEAEPLVLRCEQVAAPDDIDAQIQWRIVRARLLAHAGDAQNARARALEAVELALDTDALDRQGDAYRALAVVTGEPAHLAAARESYARKGFSMPVRPGHAKWSAN